MTEARRRAAAALFWDGAWEEAGAAYRDLLRHDAGSAGDWFGLGCCLQQQQRLAGAADAYRRALEADEALAAAWNNLGRTRLAMGDADEAAGCLRRAASLRGNRDAALRLLESARAPEPGGRLSSWRGERFDGGHLLVVANEGIGDAIQWSRHLPAVRALGGEVTLACQPAAVELFRRSGLAGSVVPVGSVPSGCDRWVPMTALDYLVHGEDRPAETPAPYLRADADRAANWACRALHAPGLDVGLVWAGEAAHPQDAERSMPFRALAPLLDVDGVNFFGLQHGPRSLESHGNRAGGRFVSLAAELDELTDVAALLTRLDLLISVDTAPVHLAGALGRPVWLLGCRHIDRRWLGGGAPLYASVRTFRQERRGDWPEVVDRVRGALRALAARHSLTAEQRPVLSQPDGLRVSRWRHGLIACRPGEPHARGIEICGEHEELRNAPLRRALRPGSTVLVSSPAPSASVVTLARAVGPRGRVIAVPPPAAAGALLRANVELNGLDNVEFLEGPGAGGAPAKLDACDLLVVDRGDDPGRRLEQALAVVAPRRPVAYGSASGEAALAELAATARAHGYRCYRHAYPAFNPANYLGTPAPDAPGEEALGLLAVHASVAQDVVGLEEIAGSPAPR